MNPLLPCLAAVALSAAFPAQSPQYALIGNGCPGSMAVSRLSLISPPAIGSLFQIEVTNLPTDAAIVFTSFSNTTSPLGPLPLALAPFGMPGCTAYVSPDFPVLVLGTNNRATFSLNIPLAAVFVGARFYQQALVLDPLFGNAIGAVVSDATEAVIAGPGGHPSGTPIPNMMPIWPGTFMMGSTQWGHWNEQPVHTVNITRPFWIGKYEVTQAEYQAVMNTNPSLFQPPEIPAYQPDRPVEGGSWNGAMAYCAALTARERAANRLPAGYQYRLPTEAEWEYCCRAGTTTEYNVGTTLSCGQANFYNNGYCVPHPTMAGQTTVVGSYAANAWGLHDMHGNVGEWCLDSWVFSGNPYPAGPVSDPYVTSGLSLNHVERGGGWYSSAPECRSAFRGYVYLTGGNFLNGFRVVLAPVLVP